MKDTSETSHHDNGENFLIAELQRSSQNNISEHDSVDKMVRNFLVLVTALIGGLGALQFQRLKGDISPSDFQELVPIVVILLLVFLIYGFSVFIRLLLRNMYGRLYQFKVKLIQQEILKKHNLKIIEQFNQLNEHFENSTLAKFGVLGGSGVAIASFNSLIVSLVIYLALSESTGTGFFINTAQVVFLIQ